MSLYSDAPVPVRDDLAEAHAAALTAWAQPGSFWSGAQRLAIAAEARTARTHAREAEEPLPPWVEPSATEGLVADDHVLPAPAIHAIWRLANHPGSLTAEWHAGIIDRGVDPHAYVELVGIVAAAVCIDTFGEAIGSAPLPHPAAGAGEPDGAIAEGLGVITHWVPTLTDGPGGNVLKSLSAIPRAMQQLRSLSDAQYVPMQAVSGDLTWDRGTINRQQIELLAARTSLLNECFY